MKANHNQEWEAVKAGMGAGLEALVRSCDAMIKALSDFYDNFMGATVSQERYSRALTPFFRADDIEIIKLDTVECRYCGDPAPPDGKCPSCGGTNWRSNGH